MTVQGIDFLVEYQMTDEAYMCLHPKSRKLRKQIVNMDTSSFADHDSFFFTFNSPSIDPVISALFSVSIAIDLILD